MGDSQRLCERYEIVLPEPFASFIRGFCAICRQDQRESKLNLQREWFTFAKRMVHFCLIVAYMRSRLEIKARSERASTKGTTGHPVFARC